MKPRTVPARMSAKRRAQFEAEGRIPFSTIQRKQVSCGSTEGRAGEKPQYGLTHWRGSRKAVKSAQPTAITSIVESNGRIHEQPEAAHGNGCPKSRYQARSAGKPRKPIPSRKKRPRPVSKTQRLRLKALKLIRDRWWAEGKRTCGICGKEILERDEYTLDHIEPGSAKSDAEDNLQPAHFYCNVFLKGSKRNFTLKGKP